MTATDPAPTARARRWWRGEAVKDALVLLALAGLSVAQPLLDLFGKNPEFFVAARSSRGQIVAFALIVTFGVAAGAVVIGLAARLLGQRVARVVHSALVGLFAVALGWTLARQMNVDRTAVFLLVGALFALLLIVGERQVPALRMVLCYAAAAPVVLCGVFLFGSATSRLLWEQEAHVDPPARIGEPHPVVMVVLDELPLASLITPDGEINAERFPGFARLARRGNWYRNATSLAPFTPISVPTMLTGRDPDVGSLPTSGDHPRNLFTLLGGTYDLDVTETATQLCPRSLCPDSYEAPPFLDGLRHTLSDASVVYGQSALPPHWREQLPSVDLTWGGFVDSAPSGGIRAFMNDRVQEIKGGPNTVKGDRLRRFVDRVDRVAPSTLWFQHDFEFVHSPWIVTPDGRPLYPTDERVPGLFDKAWSADDFLVRQGQQRELLQIGYADTLVNEMIDRLQAAGHWDDAVVVVTSDHGAAFQAGLPRRNPTAGTVDEIYRVPLFIKLPGQERGEVIDDNVVLTDILPTIVDALDIDTDWQFDGRSLMGDEPPPADKPTFHPEGPESVSVSIDGLLEMARRNRDRFPVDAGWRGVAAVGEYGPLVGTTVPARSVTGDTGATWQLDHADRYDDVDLAHGPLPLVVTGHLDLNGDAAPPREAVLVLNGQVAGIAGDFQQGDGGRWAFSGLLDYEALADGSNSIELLLPEGEASFTRVPLS